MLRFSSMQVVQIEKGMGGRNGKKGEILGVPNKGGRKRKGVGEQTEDTHMHVTVTDN